MSNPTCDKCGSDKVIKKSIFLNVYVAFIIVIVVGFISAYCGWSITYDIFTAGGVILFLSPFSVMIKKWYCKTCKSWIRIKINK